MDIRWNATRMAELAAGLERKSGALAGYRLEILETMSRLEVPAIEVRHIAIASEWARLRALDVSTRRQRLIDAEVELLWHLEARPAPNSSRPELRSRPSEAIIADLDGALGTLAWIANGGLGRSTAQAEFEVAELTYELALAERNEYLLAESLPDPNVVALFSDLIDYLGYEIAKSNPISSPDWKAVAEATNTIRTLLDESWFRDVGRGDLLEIHHTLGALAAPQVDAVIGQLGDDELYRWFHELDGIRGGNLDEAEESSMFATLARAASAATLYRLAESEGGSRFHQIAAAVRASAPPAVAMEFIELCAADAAAGDDALVAALAGIGELSGRHSSVVATALQEQGLLDQLMESLERFAERHAVERHDPVLIEFLQGLVEATATAAITAADLTVAGLVDRHRFRQAWSDIGAAVNLAITDPAQFARVVIDLETLRHNPARWSGDVAATVASAGAGRLARVGRLGRLANSAATWLKRMSRTVLVNGNRIRVEIGHVTRVLDELRDAADTAAIEETLAALADVDRYAAELGELEAILPDMAVPDAIEKSSAAAASGAVLVDRIVATLRAALGHFAAGAPVR